MSSTDRHIFLCCDLDRAKCCDAKRMLESWKFLKTRLRELGLSGRVLRTRTGCLKICAEGPIAVVYPDGVWYRHCDPEALEEIIQSHLIRGQPVERLMIARRVKPAA